MRAYGTRASPQAALNGRYTGGADLAWARQHRHDGCLPASDRADANLAQDHPRQVDDRPLIQSPIREAGSGRARGCSAPLCAALSVGPWRVGAAFASACHCRYPRLPDRATWRAPLALRLLSRRGLLLPLVQEPELSQMP